MHLHWFAQRARESTKKLKEQEMLKEHTMNELNELAKFIESSNGTMTATSKMVRRFYTTDLDGVLKRFEYSSLRFDLFDLGYYNKKYEIIGLTDEQGEYLIKAVNNVYVKKKEDKKKIIKFQKQEDIIVKKEDILESYINSDGSWILKIKN